MGIEAQMSDTAILQEIGHRLARLRLEREFTQAALAEQAGVSKRTVERIEAGESTQLSTLIRICRVLGLLDVLDAAIPVPGPRPLDLLKLRGKERQRASSKKREEPAAESWSWGEET
ncbi:helix-turn-helix transcriptional regulator [Trichloromonas sp.]|uniref:helix-turn-helix transcriptional regulator n=1 Tax=Trichloromonas sp. TaxID=3069249 RepID=UPI003D8162A3